MFVDRLDTLTKYTYNIILSIAYNNAHVNLARLSGFFAKNIINPFHKSFHMIRFDFMNIQKKSSDLIKIIYNTSDLVIDHISWFSLEILTLLLSAFFLNIF